MIDAAKRGDLAAVCHWVEEEGKEVNEKNRVRYLTAAVATSLYLHVTENFACFVIISDWIHSIDICCKERSFSSG